MYDHVLFQIIHFIDPNISLNKKYDQDEFLKIQFMIMVYY